MPYAQRSGATSGASRCTAARRSPRARRASTSGTPTTRLRRRGRSSAAARARRRARGRRRCAGRIEPPRPGKRALVLQTSGPSSNSSRPSSSRSSRRSAVSWSSPVLDAAARRAPPGRLRRRVLDTARAGRGRPRRRAARARPRACTGSSHSLQRTEPAQALGVRHGRVRGRGRRQHVERRSGRACATAGRAPAARRRAAVGLLADERDRDRVELDARRARAAPASKSPRRRSPEPGVVRHAAFVTPIPSSSSENCSCGSKRRGVKPASCSSRQKSLRGFAKCAAASAETRPGLIPQKMQVRSVREDVWDGGLRSACGHAAYSVARLASTSPCRPTSSAAAARVVSSSPAASAAAPSRCGSALRQAASASRVRAGVEALLEQLSQAVAGARRALRAAGCEPHDADALVAVPAVAAGVALGLGQRPQPHGPNPRTGVGRTEVALRDGRRRQRCSSTPSRSTGAAG